MRPTLLALIAVVACASAPTPSQPAAARRRDVGMASYYADSLAGRPTASGEPYDPRAETCAHRRLKFGTVLEITALDSGRTATCRVNDRGPFVRGRILDVSRAVAERLDMIDAGVIKVRIRPR